MLGSGRGSRTEPGESRTGSHMSKLQGRGHVIACWNYMDTSITTQFDPRTGSEAPNLLERRAPHTPRTPPRAPEALARSVAPLLYTPERNHAQHFMIGAPSSVTHSSPLMQQEEELVIVIPNTFTDANDWVSGQTGFGQGGAGDRQV